MHKVILTFDDGPEPEHTPRILDLLAKENVQAVFFVLGKKLQSPGALDIVRRAAREGHLIGNHTFSHPNLTQLSPEDIRSQIVRTHEIISEFEPKRRLFRPPYGSSNETVKVVAKELRYDPVWWDVDPKDWKKTENGPSAWVNVAIEQIRTRHRAICLCHDTSQTAAHLPQLLEKVKQLSNFQFVRYDHCRTLWRRAEFLGYRLLHKPL